jgi:hypothetical protein
MDWFETLFGFREGSYAETQANFVLNQQTLTVFLRGQPPFQNLRECDAPQLSRLYERG